MRGIPSLVSVIAVRRRGRALMPSLAVAVAGFLALFPAASAQKATVQVGAESLLDAVVEVRAEVPSGARTAKSLGTERAGNGVVIGRDGLILTIGYLVLEASAVEVVDHEGRTLSAEIVGYDHESGFGLIRAREALDVAPLEFGDSARLAERERVMVASHGGVKAAIPALVVSRREFAGYWEYLLDSAIFTSPPHPNWGGAALIGVDGRLLGIGSLIVGDAVKEEAVPGNMFVPIDLLKPILKDLIARGRSSAPPKPWLGMHTEEVRGRLFVLRVASESPAHEAGIRPGDIIVGIGDQPVGGMAELYRKVWAMGEAGIEVPLRVLQGAKLRKLVIRSADRYKFLRLKPSD